MPESHPKRPGPASSFPVRLGWVVLVLAGCLAYANSFRGAFVFDDAPQIVDNPELEEVWPGTGAFLTRQRTFTTLTLALDRALGGLDPLGYHLVNLAIHVLAGLTLFSLVRRTLLLERFGTRFQASANGLALSVALLWLVHPLQTQSVTYVIQRAESLMGLFYFLTLACALRTALRPEERRWPALAILACALGMASKPVMVTAPVVVLLFDRVFLARTWQELFRRRGWFHAGLCLTWLVIGATGLLGLLGSADGSKEATIGFGMQDVTAWNYLLTQPGVVLHYLRLAVWPHPLVIDYGWPLVEHVSQALVPAVVVGATLAISLVALARGSTLGFVGLWFFAILAPTSSFIPVRDAAFEHRMYLPLAAVVVAVVLLGHELLEYLRVRGHLSQAVARLTAVTLVVGAAVALGARTFARNADYADPVILWRGTVRDAPDNGRAYNLYAAVLEQEQRHAEALEVLQRGVERMRNLPPTEANRVYLAATHNRWGIVLVSLGHPQEALAHYRAALDTWPLAEAHCNWGVALRALGQYADALEHYGEALRLAPDSVEARNNEAWLLATCPDPSIRNGARALELATQAAAASRHRNPEFLDTLAAACAETGDFERAQRWQLEALELAPAARRAVYSAHLDEYRRGRPLRSGPGS